MENVPVVELEEGVLPQVKRIPHNRKKLEWALEVRDAEYYLVVFDSERAWNLVDDLGIKCFDTCHVEGAPKGDDFADVFKIKDLSVIRSIIGDLSVSTKELKEQKKEAAREERWAVYRAGVAERKAAREAKRAEKAASAAVPPVQNSSRRQPRVKKA